MAKVIKAAIIAVVVTFLVVTAIGAIAGTAWGAAAGITAVASAGTMYATAFIGTLVAGGIGMLTNKGISASAGNFGTKVSGLGGAVARQLIYGTTRVGGTIVKLNTRGTKNAILSGSIVVAGHECDGFDEVYFGETKLTYTTATLNGETVYTVTNTKFENADNDNAFGTDTLARFTFHDGSQTAVDGLAHAQSQYIYPATAKFLGCSYFYFELVYDPEKMPNIPKIWFVMRGKNIYDPRTSAISTTDAQRQNPALQIRDYLTNTTFGLKALASEINDSNAGGGFISAANLCDDLVTLTVDGNNDPATTERRYTSSGISNFSASGSGLIEALATSCAGNITYTNGKFNLFGGSGQTAALTITDDNLLGAPRITTQSASGELFNAVKSIYVNKNDNYQPSEVGQFTSNAFLGADTPSGEASANFKRVLELRYPFTTSETTAQRLQRISLDHQRQSTTVDLVTSLEFMKAQPNDWVYLTNSRLGYTNKTFEIQNMSMTFLENEGQIFAATSLTLQEIDASVFNFVYSEYSTPQPNAAQAVIGEVSISPPTIGTPVQITNVEGQTAKINIKAVWANAVDSAIQGTEIQFKKSTEADSLYVTATLAGIGRTTAEIANVTVGITYNIRVRHFSFDNVYSVYSSVVNIAITQPDTITNPSNLGVTTNKPFNIELSWTNPSNTNMRAVDVHFGTTTSYTPSTSNLIGTYYGDIGKKKTVLIGKSHGLSYDQNYYFKIRAVNIYGSFVESGGNPVYVTSPAGQMKRVTTVDVDEISANKLSVGVIDADVITVNNLNASKITTGQLTLTASAASAVKAGKSSYEDATTAGFFLGFTNPSVGSRVEGIYIGTATNGMRYDTAGGLVVSGNISATTGSIGGFTISTTSIRDAADSFGLSSAVTGGDDIRFYAGATLANKANAPFRVTEAGAVTATSATITGAITATSGAIGGINVDSNKIYIGTGTFNNANTAFYVDNAGKFSLKDKLSWNGTALTINGGGTFSGALSAASGTFTGALSSATGTFTGALSGGTIQIGSGQSVFKADSSGIYLGSENFGSAEFRVTPAGVLTADSATLTSATVSGAITATSGSLSSLAVSGALTVGTSGKITGGTSTSFNTGAGFFLGYDSSAYKFSIGDASTNKNLTWDGTDIKIGGAQITAPDNPSVVIYDGRSGEPPSVTSARVLLTSDTNTFYLKQDYTERLRLQVSYPLGALTSGTVSGETAAINSTMAAFKFQVYYALTSSPTNFTQFGTDASSSRQTTTGGLISNYLVKTTNLGGGNFKAELQTKTQVRTAHPTLSGLSLGAVDDNYNLTETVEADLAGGAEYVFKVVVTVTNGSASSYPATGSPASNLVRSAVVNGFQPVEKAGYGYAVEAFYQPLTTYRDGSASEVVRLSHGNDTLEVAAVDRSGKARLVMISSRGVSASPSNTLWSARMIWAKDHETYSVGSNGDYIIGLNESGSHLFLGRSRNSPSSSELQISNGRVDVIGSLYVDGSEVTGGGGSGTITNVIAGTNLNGGGTSGAVTLNLDSTISGNHTFSNNLIISGNLTVNGTTTTVDTDNLNVKDKNITLNYSTGDSSSTANGAGITIQDAVDASNNATILWNTTGDKFDFSHKVNAPSIQLGADAQPTLSGDGNTLRIQTTGGYFDIGANNSGFAHLLTDRTNFYFNRRITVDTGEVSSYDEDLTLMRVGSTAARLRITAGTTISDQPLSVTGNIAVTGTVDGVDIATRDGVLTTTTNTANSALSTANSATTTANAALPKAGGTITGDVKFNAASKWNVSSSDVANQRADARDDAGSFSRLHWYGESDNGSTSNFRHSWYDGANYITVTAASGTATFGGILAATGGTSTNWNTAYTYSQVGHLPLSGGTLTGTLSSNSNIETTLDIKARILYSKNTNNTYLDLDGSLSANLNASGAVNLLIGGAGIFQARATGAVVYSGSLMMGSSLTEVISANRDIANIGTITNDSTVVSKNLVTGLANGTFSSTKTIGALHIANGVGSSSAARQSGITFQGDSATEAQAGIYVTNDNSSGTHMAFATTNSYSTGPQFGLTISNVGVVNIPRNALQFGGTTAIDANRNLTVGTIASGAINIASGGLSIGGTEVINSSRQLTNIALGDISTNKITLLNGASANMEMFVSGTGTATTNFRLSNASSNIMTLSQTGNLTTAGSITTASLTAAVGSGNVLINQSSVTYTNTDNTSLIATPMANVLHVNGSIQMKENNSAIVFGRGTSTFLQDEELAFGWGGGIYMTDQNWLRIRNNKGLYTTGILHGGSLQINGTQVIDSSRNLFVAIASVNSINNNDASLWYTNSSDRSHQRADARSDGSSNTFSRLHWYGVTHAQGTSNFRHAWYDGASYINVTAASGTVTFGGGISSSGISVTSTSNSAIYVGGNSGGLYFAGGNNRIFFSGHRALEGDTGGTTLQLGEGYTTTLVQSNLDLSSGHTVRINGTEIITSSRNLTNIGTINSGAITAGGTTQVTASEFRITSSAGFTTHLNYNNTGTNFISQANGGFTQIRNNGGALVSVGSSGTLNVHSGNFQMGATTVIDSSRRFTPANSHNTGTTPSNAVGGSIDTSGGTTLSGRFLFTGYNDNGGKLWGWNAESSRAVFYNYTDDVYALKIDNSSNVDISSGSLQVGGTTVIDVSRNLTNLGVINGANQTSVADRIGNIKIARIHPSSGTSPVTNIDNLETFILSKTDGGYGGGTKPAGSHNGTAILSFQTHAGNYYTQLALSTNTNDLFIRSANGVTSYGAYQKLLKESTNITVGTISSGNITVGTISSGSITASGIAAGSVSSTAGSIVSYGALYAGQGGVYTNNVERITNAGNLTNIGTISSGAISATGAANSGSASHLPAFLASGNYGGGIATRDTKESGWYQQTNGADWHFYHNRTVASDTPASKKVLSFNSSGNATFAGTISSGAITSTSSMNAAGGYYVSGTEVIDASRNLTNIGSITATSNSGIGITPNAQKLVVGGQAQTRVQIDGSSTAGVYFTIGGANGATIRSGSTNNLQFYTTGLAATIDSSMNFNISSGGLQFGGTQVIDSSRNLTVVDANADSIGNNGASYWYTNSSDRSHQRADARSDGSSSTFSRLHWYGVHHNQATSNFRHAWYDGASYINVTAASGTVTFTGALTSTGNIASNGSNFSLGTTAVKLLNGPYASGNIALQANSASYSCYLRGGTTDYAYFSNTTSTLNRRMQILASTSQGSTTPNIKSKAQGSSNGVTQYHINFTDHAGTVDGRITSNGYATSYTTTSDYRVKEDVQPMAIATATLLALNPVNFKWVSGDDRTDGFLAHEVAELVPDAVVGEKDATEEVTDDEGVTTTVDSLQALDQAKLIPLLVKTIQELEARIKILES